MKTHETKGRGIATTSRSAREDKKSINIKPRTVRYFQFGLLIGLFAVLLILEANVGFSIDSYAAPREVKFTEDPSYKFVIEKNKPVAKNEKPVENRPVQKKVISDIIKTAKNDAAVIETPIEPTKGIETPVIPTVTAPVATTTPTETRNTLNVEFVPVFPGCEGYSSNGDKIACMSSKINDFIGRKFRTNDFDYLEEGVEQKIYVQFTIDSEGYVTDIKARAPDKKLEKEAMRVIAQLPTMKPGKQGSTSVNVQYSVPITFQVSN